MADATMNDLYEAITTTNKLLVKSISGGDDKGKDTNREFSDIFGKTAIKDITEMMEPVFKFSPSMAKMLPDIEKAVPLLNKFLPKLGDLSLGVTELFTQLSGLFSAYGMVMEPMAKFFSSTIKLMLKKV